MIMKINYEGHQITRTLLKGISPIGSLDFINGQLVRVTGAVETGRETSRPLYVEWKILEAIAAE